MSSEAELSTEERATLALSSIEGIGPVTLATLRKAFGSLSAVLTTRPEAVAPFLRDEPTRARFLKAPNLFALADICLEEAARVGAKPIFPGSPNWPSQLIGIDSPSLLYVRGSLRHIAKRAAIVGARETDEYGAKVSAFLASNLAKAGVEIVSGGALGVDGIAHRAAIESGRPTVAVLGTGIDNSYPRENESLFSQIVARGGAVVSQFAPGTPPARRNFLIRNRTIAALCDVLIVTRAGNGSGALSTAKAASELGRPVFAVPGDITHPLSAGTNGLLERGEARAAVGIGVLGHALVLEGTELLDIPPCGQSSGKSAGGGNSLATSGEYAGADIRQKPMMQAKLQDARSNTVDSPLLKATTAKLEKTDEIGGAAPIGDQVPAELRAVWKALGEGPKQFEELVQACRVDAAELASLLVRLEVLGLCREQLGKVFVRR